MEKHLTSSGTPSLRKGRTRLKLIVYREAASPMRRGERTEDSHRVIVEVKSRKNIEREHEKRETAKLNRIGNMYEFKTNQSMQGWCLTGKQVDR